MNLDHNNLASSKWNHWQLESFVEMTTQLGSVMDSNHMLGKPGEDSKLENLSA